MSEDTVTMPRAAGELFHSTLASPVANRARDVQTALCAMVEAERGLAFSTGDKARCHDVALADWLHDAEIAWDALMDALHAALDAPFIFRADRTIHMMLRHVQVALRSETPTAFADVLELASAFADLVEDDVEGASSDGTAGLVRALATALHAARDIDAFRDLRSCGEDAPILTV